MAEINQTAAEKMYTVGSRETIYEGNGKDTDVNPLCDSDTWYEGAGRVEALRTVREYTADVRDMGKVEVCERGIARNVFEVCETLLDEDGDVIGENTIEIVDPLDRMPELREFADKADHCNCQFPSYITGECKWIDDVEFDGKCYGSTASSIPPGAISARTPTTAPTSGSPQPSSITA